LQTKPRREKKEEFGGRELLGFSEFLVGGRIWPKFFLVFGSEEKMVRRYLRGKRNVFLNPIFRGIGDLL
jgi:hypothetical protein